MLGYWVKLHFQKYLGGDVDLEYKKYGDGGVDVVIDGFSFDIKTSRRKSYVMYVMSVTENGYKIPPTADFYVAQFLKDENRKEMTATIVIVGYQTGKYIATLRDVKSPVRNSTHLNKEVLYKNLISFL